MSPITPPNRSSEFDVNTAAEALRHADPPAQLRERIASAVFAPAPMPAVARRFRLRPALSFAVAGGAAVALALLWQAPYLLRSGQDTALAPVPGVAFARVEEAMTAIRTATWQESVTYYDDKSGSPKVDGPSIFWTDLRGPIICTHTPQPPGGGGTLDTYHSPGFMVLRHPKRGYQLWYSRSRPESDASLRRYLMSNLIFHQEEVGQGEEKHVQPYETVKSSAWTADQAMRNGKTVLRFRQSIRIIDAHATRLSEVTVFADPESYRIVRREVRGFVPNTDRTYSLGVAEGFQYNTPPPFTLKDITPPAGVPVNIHYAQRTRGGKGPDSHTTAEIQALIARAGETWSRADWNAFAALWDFDHYDQVNPLEASGRKETTKQYVRSLFEARQPYADWRLDKVTSLDPAGNTIYRRRSNTEPFPPKTLPDAFQVQARLQAREQGGKSARPTMTFTVIRGADDTLRITHIRFGGYDYISPLGRKAGIGSGRRTSQ